LNVVKVEADFRWSGSEFHSFTPFTDVWAKDVLQNLVLQSPHEAPLVNLLQLLICFCISKWLGEQGRLNIQKTNFMESKSTTFAKLKILYLLKKCGRYEI